MCSDKRWNYNIGCSTIKQWSGCSIFDCISSWQLKCIIVIHSANYLVYDNIYSFVSFYIIYIIHVQKIILIQLTIKQLSVTMAIVGILCNFDTIETIISLNCVGEVL